MSSIRNSGRGRGRKLLALIPLAALLAALLPASAAQSTPRLSGNSVFSSMLSTLQTVNLAAADGDDEYVPATIAGTNHGELADAEHGELAARTSSGMVGIIYPGGPGHPTDVYAVKWNSDSRDGWCYRFGLHTPNSNGAQLVSQIPGMTRDQSRHVFDRVNRYHGTSSDVMAAAMALFTWHFEDSPGFRRWFPWAKKNDKIGAAVLRTYNRLLVESKKHGPFKVNVNLGAKKTVGQRGHGSVTVKNAHGAVKGIKVSLDKQNLRFTDRKAMTNNKGKLPFTYIVTSSGRVSVHATVKSSGIKGHLSSPSSGNQALVLFGPGYKKSASAHYGVKAPKPEVTVSCDEGCKKAKVTMSGKNPAGAKPVRFVIEAGGKARARLDIRPGRSKSLTKLFADDTDIEVITCYLDKVDGRCVTPRVTVMQRTVFCPTEPGIDMTIKVTGKCGKCTSTTTSLAFNVDSPRFYWISFKEGSTDRTFKLQSDGESHTVPDVSDVVTDFRWTAYENADRTGRHRSGEIKCAICS